MGDAAFTLTAVVSSTATASSSLEAPLATSSTDEAKQGDESATATTPVVGNTTTAVASSENPSGLGQLVTFTATVSSNNGRQQALWSFL